jgi:hypothetical protein
LGAENKRKMDLRRNERNGAINGYFGGFCGLCCFGGKCVPELRIIPFLFLTFGDIFLAVRRLRYYVENLRKIIMERKGYF